MPRRPYNVLEHPADLRLAVFGADLRELLANAAYAMVREMLGTEPPPATGPMRAVTLDAQPEELLLRAWLAELLFLFESEHEVPTEWDVTLRPDGGLSALVRGVPASDLTHPIATEIKAVTYYGLAIEVERDGLRAEIIFDL